MTLENSIPRRKSSNATLQNKEQVATTEASSRHIAANKTMSRRGWFKNILPEIANQLTNVSRNVNLEKYNIVDKLKK